jgi:hypothetical protein
MKPAPHRQPGTPLPHIVPRKLLCAALATLLIGAASYVYALPPAQDDGAVAMGSQGRMVRGTITAVSQDQFSVKTDSGDLFKVTVTTNTRIMKDRQPVKFADIHVGDGVGAMGVIDAPNKTIHAAGVFVVDAAAVKKMRDDMGKTYISGKVTAINELQLTITRQDGLIQTIAVDEGTSFKRGGRREGMAMRGDGSAPGGDVSARAGAPPTGESITLADVKVGDTVVGPGAIKAGTFVPTQLTVIDAAAMGRRRRPEGVPSPDQAPAGAEQH